MRKLIAACALFAASAVQGAQIKGMQPLEAPLLKGNLTQGGLVIGKLANAKQVTLNDTPLKQNQAGYFVFGFGRDAKPTQVLKWQNAQGQWQQKTLQIKAQKYNIDRIEGVAKKYVSPPKNVLERISRDGKAIKQARATNSNLNYFLDTVYKPAQGRISGVYGSQRYFNGKPKRPHYGLDIANKTGSPVYAPVAGKVLLAEPDLYYSGGTLILDHGFGVTSTYIHLHKLHVKVGQTVKTGDKIAQIGATGRVTGPHLDWRFNWFNTRLDPALIMNNTLATKED